MTASRLALASLAVLVGAAGLLHALRGHDELAPPTPAAPQPPRLAAPAELAAPNRTPSGPTTVQALPTVPAAARAPRIGSEGYGPHIERALAGEDAAEGWEAVHWLRLCISNETQRNSFEKSRDQGVVPELTTQLMLEADVEARRCQTVTAQHHAMLPVLAARAIRAGLPDAVAAYEGALFPGDLGPAQRREVAAAVLRDARAGEAQSLLAALLSHDAWGLSDTDRLAFLIAYGELPGQQERDRNLLQSLQEQGRIRFKAPQTPEQQATAWREALQIVGPPRR